MEFNPDTCFTLLQNCLVRVHNRPGTPERLFAARALRTSMFKKWLPPDSRPLDKVAKLSFLAANATCEKYTADFSPFTDVGRVLNSVRARMHMYFHSGELQSNRLTYQACLDGGKCGPGASVGTKRTDFYGKLADSTLTYTDEGLYTLFKYGTNATWRNMDHYRSLIHGQKRVIGSNSTTVPKDSSTNRMIGTEPSLNMFFQLGAGKVIEQLLLEFHNIDLSTQPNINKSLAKLSSINGKFATVDLRNASNTISTGFVKPILPAEPFRVLDFIRSKKTKIDGKFIDLHMFSSMGNGFTSPLQTLIFATLVREVYELLGIKPVAFGPNRNYGVFGDDIICVSEAYDKLVEILAGCGFEVNRTKSYASGPFRESCGGDYFRGTDVRGVYLREINAEENIYSIFNRLVRWSIKHRVDLSDVLDYLLGLVEFRPVPFDAGDTAGFKYPMTYLKSPKRVKHGAIVYHGLEAEPNVQEILDDFSLNAYGLHLAYLGGFSYNRITNVRRDNDKVILSCDEGHHFTARSNAVIWKVVRRKTPSWDFIPHAGLTIQDYEAVWMTLTLKK